MILRLKWILILSLGCALAASAQERHVKAVINIDGTAANLASDDLYVINMPSQFMSVGLSGHYSRIPQPTDALKLSLVSYALKPLDEPATSHGLRIKADDQILDFGALSYLKADARTPAGLPAPALIAKNKNQLVTVETMSTGDLSVADLAKIAEARNVIMKVGDTVFPLTPRQLTIMQEFIKEIPIAREALDAFANSNPPSEPPADVPSDKNNAALDETLKWIKVQIDREGSTRDPVVQRKLEFLDFSTCRLRYRLMPLVREVPTSSSLIYAIMEYQVNLADLNADAVRVKNSGLYSWVYASTQNFSPKIKVIKHMNEHSSMGRTLDESQTSNVSMNMKNLEAANRLRFALIHAIHLCQTQPKYYETINSVIAPGERRVNADFGGI